MPLIPILIFSALAGGGIIGYVFGNKTSTLTILLVIGGTLFGLYKLGLLKRT